MRDVACAGYVAGCNTLFFAQDSMGGDSYSMENARTHMMERLSFSNDVGAKYASMLAFPCTAQQMSSGHLDTVMSVTTRLLPWEVTTATGGDHHSFPGGQKVFGEYQGKLNLRSVHFGEVRTAAVPRPPPIRPPTHHPLLTPSSPMFAGHEGRREPGLHLARLHQQRHVLQCVRSSIKPCTPARSVRTPTLTPRSFACYSRSAPPLRPVHQG